MVKLTMIARVTDGLPLAEGLEDGRDQKDADFYKQQAKALFKNLSKGQNHPSRMSIETGPYVFHYIIEGHVCYLTMCDRSYPKKLAFQYLEDLKNEFERVTGGQIETAARPYAFIKFDTFIQKTKKLYLDTRTQRNLAKLNDELYEVHQIMTRNVQEVLGVGEKLDRINAPTSQSFSNYVLLALVYGSILLYRKQKLKAKWYYYIMLGVVDVEANFLVVKAYQYTSLTSVMLLDCWTIPSVIFLTWLFLKTKYRYRKFAGVAICVLGLVMVVFSDVHASDRAGGSNPVKGDLLVIAGSMLYAVSNVSEEFFVKKADRVELMAMLGLFGAIVSAIQISILERQELRSIHWSAGAVLPFTGFAAAMFVFYSTVPILLKRSGSTMLNLSLLTSDMWAVLIRIFAYHEKVDWMYFVAFAAVALGLVIYSGGSKEDESEMRTEVGEQSKERDEELGVKDQYKECTVESCKRGDGKNGSCTRTDQAETTGIVCKKNIKDDAQGR